MGKAKEDTLLRNPQVFAVNSESGFYESLPLKTVLQNGSLIPYLINNIIVD
jgi:hypothetical protein